ncbi:MAG TPA: ferritin-like domain-containing protein [Coriobacteriia bacterium]|jgi:rubrerythrin
MDKRLQIEHLGRLLHVEVHAVSAYDGAIERIRDEGRRRHLEGMRDDHERHVIDITELLREMGEPAPGPTPEVERLFAPAMSALKNGSADDDVLHAMRMNEQVLAHEYANARGWGVGLQVHDLLARNDADEQRHLSAIEEMLAATGTPARP